MAVMLDATPGGAAANSYISHEEALSYIADVRLEDPPPEWVDGGPDKQKKALIRATREISARPFPGRASSWGHGAQALFFPRAQDGGAIPGVVKQATVELALFLLSRPADAQMRENLQAQGVQSVTLGKISESFRPGGARSVIDQCPVVVSLLRQAGYGGPVALG